MIVAYFSCITLIVYAIQRAGTSIGFFFGSENHEEHNAYGWELLLLLLEKEECA